MTHYLLVGEGEALDQAVRTSREIAIDCTVITLESADRYNFDISGLLAHYPPQDSRVFVALDQRAVNYARHKLIADVRMAGYQLFDLISPKAIVEDDIRLPGNVYIGPGCNIAADCKIGLGVWLDRQVILDRGVQLGSCVTLLAGVVLGKKVKIGTGSTLSSGCTAADGTQVGRHCEWLLGGRLPPSLPDTSFFDQLMPEGARVFKNG